MFAYLHSALELTQAELITALVVVLFAGLVRGFAGFGLSALVMAGLALIIAPVSLIPVCFLLEAVASAMMIRSGFKNANRKLAWGLAISSAIGVPLGLAATMNLPEDLSRLIALLLIMVLAVLQLLRKSPAFLATQAGLYVSGLAAGIATGLASVGGMVVALYVLSQNTAPSAMRGSLVMYLFLGMFTSVFWLGTTGLLDALAIKRALFLAPVAIIGVLLGTELFRPSMEMFYKRFCLALLIFLAITGVFRLLLS